MTKSRLRKALYPLLDRPAYGSKIESIKFVRISNVKYSQDYAVLKLVDASKPGNAWMLITVNDQRYTNGDCAYVITDGIWYAYINKWGSFDDAVNTFRLYYNVQSLRPEDLDKFIIGKSDIREAVAKLVG